MIVMIDDDDKDNQSYSLIEFRWRDAEVGV